MGIQVMVKNVRLAFSDAIWEAKAFQGGDGKKAFSATFPIEPKSANVALIENAIQQVAKEEWKDKFKAILKKLKADKRVCYSRDEKTSAEGDVYEGFEGMYALAARGYTRPLIIDRDKTQLVESDGRPYAGCYVDVLVEIWAQKGKWGKRVNASLKAIRFLEDGDAFGGGTPANVDDFDDLADTEVADSTEDGADDDLF